MPGPGSRDFFHVLYSILFKLVWNFFKQSDFGNFVMTNQVYASK